MKFSTPFVAAKDWYLRRHLAWKIVLGGVAGLILVVGLYIFTRAMQYAASAKRAGEFLPTGADLRLELPSLADTLDEFFATEAWEAIHRRLLRDRGIRKSINEALQESGLPTLDNLEDRRWHRRNDDWLTLDGINRLAGRDCAMAVNLRGADPSFFVATKITFGDYLLLPFAWVAPGLVGAETEKIGGYSCLRMMRRNKPFWITHAGAVVIVSNDQELLTAGLKRPGQDDIYDGYSRLRVDFTKSQTLTDAKNTLALGPLGGLLRDVDLTGATGVTVEQELRDHDVVINTVWTGLQNPGRESPVQFLDYAPEDSAGFIASTTSGTELWKWMQESFQQGTMQKLVELLQQSALESDLLPLAKPGTSWILGSEQYIDDRPYTAVTVCVPVNNGLEAYESMKAVMYEVISKDDKKWVHTEWQGYPLSYFQIPGDWKQEPLARLCFAGLPDTLLIGNNPEFLQKLIETSTGQKNSLKESAGLRVLEAAMRERGVKELMDDQAVLNLFLSFGPLVESLEGPIPILAEWMMDTDETRAKLRQEMRQEGLDFETIDRQFNNRMETRIRQKAEEIHRSFRFLRHMRWMAVQAKSTGSAMQVRLVLRLK